MQWLSTIRSDFFPVASILVSMKVHLAPDFLTDTQMIGKQMQYWVVIARRSDIACCSLVIFHPYCTWMGERHLFMCVWGNLLFVLFALSFSALNLQYGA